VVCSKVCIIFGRGKEGRKEGGKEKERKNEKKKKTGRS